MMLEHMYNLYDVINVVNETLSSDLDHVMMNLDELESKQENDISIFFLLSSENVWSEFQIKNVGLLIFLSLKRLVYSRVDIHLGD